MCVLCNCKPLFMRPGGSSYPLLVQVNILWDLGTSVLVSSARTRSKMQSGRRGALWTPGEPVHGDPRSPGTSIRLSCAEWESDEQVTVMVVG